MMALPATASAPRRRVWDPPSRSPVLERFYRELMAVESLPSAPEVAQRMLVAINRDDVSLRALSSLIERDQSLAARLLRLANSALFAVRTKVTGISQAVTLLGFSRVRDLVLGLSVWGALEGSSPEGRRYRKHMWNHTAMVAAAAKLLAERTRSADPGQAFTAGLLHDVGKLVLGLRLGDTYWSLLDDAVEQGGAAAAEQEAFGCNHGMVGGWLLQLWGMPLVLVDPVALHTEALDPDYGLDLPAIVAVADRLVHSTDASSGAARQDVLDELSAFAPGLVDGNAWKEIWAALHKEQQALGGMFGD
ncbi:MAG TPA: HDOD domain-containing protein [Candidatus Binatia bacterium]|nr:HDOD domain-containing protein [Candidatus Binatia bacterium]